MPFSFQHVIKAVSEGIVGFLQHTVEAKKAVQAQSFNESLSDLFLCGFFSLVSQHMRSNKSNDTCI